MIPGRMFRFFLEHCLHQAQTDGEGKPEPLRCLTHCCLRCCLDGAARLLQYLSHNAYILVAVRPHPNPNPNPNPNCSSTSRTTHTSS